MNKKTVDDICPKGKRVLVRCDFNVPIKDGVITDETRIIGALPTIKKLIDDGAKVILCSHMGKPKGEPKPEFSLAPVAVRLSEKLGINPKYRQDDYWRHGMTITSPCYYVSYSVSAISVLQLYEVAQTDGFDVAKEQYLKLFTYVDEDPEMGMQDILKYAGMLSFKDEQLYVDLSAYFARK